MPIPDISLESAEHRLKEEDKQFTPQLYEEDAAVRPEDWASLHDNFFDECLLADFIVEGVVDPPPKGVVEYRVTKTSLSTLSETFQNQSREDVCGSNCT